MKVCKVCRSTHDGKMLLCPRGHVLRTDPPDDLLIGRVLDNRYEVRAKLGGGGFGMVYMAAEIRLADRPAVVKVARPELAGNPAFVARFEREKKALMTLRCRNTVQILDYGRTEDSIDYIVMEYIEGRPLDVVLKEHGRIEKSRALAIASGICCSLEEAHAAGILHRDLKPANVMLVQVGTTELVKVIDFGIARLADGADSGFHTRTGEMPGTPLYASVEQLLGRTSVLDGRTDVYSLGAMLYEMLCGVAPYGDSVSASRYESSTQFLIALAQAKMSVGPTLLSSMVPDGMISPQLDELVMSMLDMDPGKRPADAAEVRTQIARITTPVDTFAELAVTDPSGFHPDTGSGGALPEPVPAMTGQEETMSQSSLSPGSIAAAAALRDQRAAGTEDVVLRGSESGAVERTPRSLTWRRALVAGAVVAAVGALVFGAVELAGTGTDEPAAVATEGSESTGAEEVGEASEVAAKGGAEAGSVAGAATAGGGEKDIAAGTATAGGLDAGGVQGRGGTRSGDGGDGAAAGAGEDGASEGSGAGAGGGPTGSGGEKSEKEGEARSQEEHASPGKDGKAEKLPGKDGKAEKQPGKDGKAEKPPGKDGKAEKPHSKWGFSTGEE